MTRQMELKLLIQSIGDMHKVLIPVIVVVLFVVYFFSLLMTVLIPSSSQITVYPSYSRWNGTEYWGSIPGSMFTLFQLVSGDNWAREIARPLIEFDSKFVILFVPFIMVMCISLKSALIAKFCDQIIQSGNVAENRLKAQEKKIKDIVVRLELNFILGKIRDEPTPARVNMKFGELEKFIIHSDNRKLLTQLNIPISELSELYCILDTSGNEFVDVSIFFRSLLQLTGPAMGRHITSLQMMSASLSSRCVALNARVAKFLSRVENLTCIGEISSVFSVTHSPAKDGGMFRPITAASGNGGDDDASNTRRYRRKSLRQIRQISIREFNLSCVACREL
jgi:hypothetical protein